MEAVIKFELQDDDILIDGKYTHQEKCLVQFMCFLRADGKGKFFASNYVDEEDESRNYVNINSSIKFSHFNDEEYVETIIPKEFYVEELKNAIDSFDLTGTIHQKIYISAEGDLTSHLYKYAEYNSDSESSSSEEL